MPIGGTPMYFVDFNRVRRNRGFHSIQKFNLSEGCDSRNKKNLQKKRGFFPEIQKIDGLNSNNLRKVQ
jgi:hypothetical protein